MNKYISEILKSRRCVFVSPHLDDAVFSAGGLMLFLKSRGVKLTVINVFTSSGKLKNTLSARVYLKQCGYSSVEALYKTRLEEDKNVAKKIGARQINFGFTEALWREKNYISKRGLRKYLPELDAMYPTYRWHVISGKINPKDQKTIQAIKAKLLRQKDFTESTYIFTSLGIGNHVDHLVTREAVNLTGKQVLLWEDYPYILTGKSIESSDMKTGFEYHPEWRKKLALMNLYRSQYKPIFGSMTPTEVDEKYFFLKEK